MNSECSDGYIGPLCQTCDIKQTIKYAKQGIYECIPCKSLQESIPELFLLSLCIFGFFTLILW